jgi:DNA replication protein DnaC
MATACAPLAPKAAKEKLSHEAFLSELARLECEERTQRRVERNVQQSKLPQEKTLLHVRVARVSMPLRLQIERLKSGAFVEQAHNVLLVGPPGSGKRHLAAGLGQELIKQGQTVFWSTTVALVQRLLAAKRAFCLPQEIARLDRCSCLLLDDIGSVQQDHEDMDVLFTPPFGAR